MIITKIAKFKKMTKILPEWNSDVLAVKITKTVIKILQGSAVTQNALGGLIIHNLFATFL